SAVAASFDIASGAHRADIWARKGLSHLSVQTRNPKRGFRFLPDDDRGRRGGHLGGHRSIQPEGPGQVNLAYLATFTQTCLIEWPIYHFYLRSQLSLRRSLCFVFLVNAFTHPVVFFGFLGLKVPFLHALLVAEVFAYSVEAWACWKIAGLRPRNA